MGVGWRVEPGPRNSEVATVIRRPRGELLKAAATVQKSYWVAEKDESETSSLVVTKV